MSLSLRLEVVFRFSLTRMRYEFDSEFEIYGLQEWDVVIWLGQYLLEFSNVSPGNSYLKVFLWWLVGKRDSADWLGLPYFWTRNDFGVPV
eukprot:386687-Amorphochlora_amoeboformis.AAC.1